jgi:putative ABC transport system substrate-binding protein
LSLVEAKTPEDLSHVVAAAKRSHARALYFIDDALSFANRVSICRLASRARLPSIAWVRDFPDDGGFMSYGPNFIDMYRRAAGFVDKILEGAKPGDLPFERPTKFELAVNLKTARTIGITIPGPILARADEVLQ